jgi:hypothetical protein
MLALLEVPTFTPYVGVAPGTTTMTLGAAKRAARRVRQRVWWNPYVDIPTLRGLGQPTVRWDLFALALGASFAGVVGYAYWRHRK